MDGIEDISLQLTESMALNANDKARRHLYNELPELHYLEKKNIFSMGEISAISQKRMNFELAINSPRCLPSAFTRYIEYEINLHKLARKRISRQGVKNVAFYPQGKIFSLFRCAVRRFPANLELWLLYIAYAQQEHAYKRLAGILASVLKLHPTKSELWVLAAKYYLDVHDDIYTAKEYLSRGLKFCNDDHILWIQRGKIEMIHAERLEEQVNQFKLKRCASRLADSSADELSADCIRLPSDRELEMQLDPSVPDIDLGDFGVTDDLETKWLDEEMDKLTEIVPASKIIQGISVCDIFNSAMSNTNNDTTLASQFYNMVNGFNALACRQRVCRHIHEKGRISTKLA